MKETDYEKLYSFLNKLEEVYSDLQVTGLHPHYKKGAQVAINQVQEFVDEMQKEESA